MNRLLSLLGCEYPIVEGGLAYVGNGTLAGAISAAGGFGQVGSAGRTIEQLLVEIDEATKVANGRPFGVNLPLSEHSDREEYVSAILDQAERIKAVSLSAGNPRPYIERFKSKGIVVMTVVASPAQAKKVEAAGADLVIAEGYEAGGHNGLQELTTMALIPQVVRAVSIPVVAAGGIASGEGIAAALALGADGVQIGTRFVATTECQAHGHYKEELITKTGEDTRVIERSLGRITRVLNSPFVEKILTLEQNHPGWDVLAPYLRGESNRKAAIDGNVENGWLNCGQGVGLIDDVISVRELMERLISEAKGATQRLSSLFSGKE